MKQLVTTGIVLSRIDYGEADRILTVLTPDYGKLRLMARGSRKVRSKLAAGIELFSVSDLTFIEGRGEIGTLISSRLRTHFGDIVKDINRVQLGYELIKLLNKVTEDQPEPDYFELLQKAFERLNDPSSNLDLVRIWFQAQLLRLGGHEPNLATDTQGQSLAAEQTYSFSFDDMAFVPQDRGSFQAPQIKFLRLLFSQNSPLAIGRVANLEDLLADCVPLLKTMAQTHLRV